MKPNEFIVEYAGIGEDAEAMAADNEVQLARQQCYHAARDAIALHHILKDVSEQEGLESWVSEKLTQAASSLNDVIDHLEQQRSGGDEGGMNDIMDTFSFESAEALYTNMLSEQQLSELDSSTMQAYLEKRKATTTPGSMRKAGTQAAGVRSAKEKIHDKAYTAAAKAKGDPRMQEGQFDDTNKEIARRLIHRLQSRSEAYLVSVIDTATGERNRIEVKVSSPEAAKEQAEQMGYKVLGVKKQDGVDESATSGLEVFKVKHGDLVRVGPIDYLYAQEDGQWYSRRNDYKAGRDIAPKWMREHKVPNNVRSAIPQDDRDDEVDESFPHDVDHMRKNTYRNGEGMSKTCPHCNGNRFVWTNSDQGKTPNHLWTNPNTATLKSKEIPCPACDGGKKRVPEGSEQDIDEAAGYKIDKPYGVKYKVFAGREGRITTKEYWCKTIAQLDRAVTKIENLVNFYEIDGYSYPHNAEPVEESKVNELSTATMRKYVPAANRSREKATAEYQNTGKLDPKVADKMDRRAERTVKTATKVNAVKEDASAGGCSAGAIAASVTGAKANKPGTGKPKAIGNKVSRKQVQVGKGIY